MPDITVETLFNQIAQLPQPERLRLWQMLEPLAQPAPASNGTPRPTPVENGMPQPAPPKKKLQPISVPDSTRELRWLAEHWREYVGQWVALDGDRLIAHGPDAKEVYAAADADGAYLPLVDLVWDRDRPSVF